ncbi:MAG TPA: amidase [Bryobacteraceae bacterium]|nr:amidase [Bryobacteraceae bacterium]
MTLLEAAAALRRRETSSAELTAAALQRIERLNPSTNAMQTVMADAARERARQADEELARGEGRGPLHGIPIAVKDLFCTAGVRTTGGSSLFANYVPDHDATVVEWLRAGGAVLVGKTGMHELAYGITSSNPHFGVIRNPWDRDRIPGGSSGGSGAAVAAGMVSMAMGTDTGGSIRIPASFCGVVGLKPTYGRVSRYGGMTLGFSLDHMGPLTRSVRDAAAVLNVIAGYDSRDPTSSRRPVENYVPDLEPSIRGLRVGLPDNFYFDRLDPEVDSAVRAAFRTAESRGAEIVPVRVPDIAAINTVARLILLAEASALLEPHLEQRDRFGADVLSLLDQGRLVAATDYINAQRLRGRMQREFAGLWQRVDCLFTPTTPITAPRIGETTVALGGVQNEDVRLASTRLVRGINPLGLPAVSIPCGADRRGLPIGLQIVGPPFAEALILRIAQALLPGEAPVPPI